MVNVEYYRKILGGEVLKTKRSIIFAIVGTLLIMLPLNAVTMLPGIKTLIGDVSTSTRQVISATSNILVIIGNIIMCVFFYNCFIKQQINTTTKVPGLFGLLGFGINAVVNSIYLISNCLIYFIVQKPSNRMLNMYVVISMNVTANLISYLGIILIIICFSIYYTNLIKGDALRRISLLVLIGQYVALVNGIIGFVFYRFLLPGLDYSIWESRLEIITNMQNLIGLIPFVFLLIYLIRLYGLQSNKQENYNIGVN